MSDFERRLIGCWEYLKDEGFPGDCDPIAVLREATAEIRRLEEALAAANRELDEKTAFIAAQAKAIWELRSAAGPKWIDHHHTQRSPVEEDGCGTSQLLTFGCGEE